MKADPKKTATMQQWPTATNVRPLRGFLGLTGYYKKFVQDYGQIAAPLTALLKKDYFSWFDDAEHSFVQLKLAVSNPPCAGFTRFQQAIYHRMCASGQGLGVVLMQDQRPIALNSQALKGRSLSLSTYEKELLALVTAIKNWNLSLGQTFLC